jgi:hypothetical protein
MQSTSLLYTNLHGKWTTHLDNWGSQSPGQDTQRTDSVRSTKSIVRFIGVSGYPGDHLRRSRTICQMRCWVMPKTSAKVAIDSPFLCRIRISALRAHLGKGPSEMGDFGRCMPRYEIAIANATANKTWGNDLPRSPLWGTKGHGLLHCLSEKHFPFLIAELCPESALLT